MKLPTIDTYLFELEESFRSGQELDHQRPLQQHTVAVVDFAKHSIACSIQPMQRSSRPEKYDKIHQIKYVTV